MTLKTAAGIIAIVWCLPTIGRAQDVQGAQRIEIDSAVFGGGSLIIDSKAPSAEASHSYIVGGAVTTNLNKWVGIEGEVGWGLGHHAAHELYGVVPIGAHAPNMLTYGGNLVVNPMRSDRPFIPYAVGGLGALHTFGVAPGSAFGLAEHTTYLTPSIGAGVRWYPIRHWGVRADYRFLHIRHDTHDARPGEAIARSAHRVYAALVLTF